MRPRACLRISVARKPFNSQSLIYHLTHSNECGNLQTKVLLTVSPFRPFLLPQPLVFSRAPYCKFFRMRSLAPNSLEGYGKCARNPFRFRSYKNAPSASRVTSFCRSFVFITLQIPLPATPFFSHPYKTPGRHPPVFPQDIATSVSRACLANPMFSAACRLFVSLCPLFRTRSLCFQAFAASFAKIPGWGVRLAFGVRTSDALWHARMGLRDVPTFRHNAKIHPTPL